MRTTVMISSSLVFGSSLTMILLPPCKDHWPSEMLSKHHILHFPFSPRRCCPWLQSPLPVTHIPTRSCSVTRTGAGVGIAASRMPAATITAIVLTKKKQGTTGFGQHYGNGACAQRQESCPNFIALLGLTSTKPRP